MRLNAETLHMMEMRRVDMRPTWSYKMKKNNTQDEEEQKQYNVEKTEENLPPHVNQ